MAVYVMSDLHGRKERFDRMLKRICFDSKDTLYILGDVIDRGEAGIALLQQIQNQENMILLMGNHEHMMIEYMQAEAWFQQGKNILENMMIMRRWDLNHNESTKMSFQALEMSEQASLLAYLQTLPIALPNIVVNDHRYYLVHATPHSCSYHESHIDLAWCKEHNCDPYCFLWERNDGQITLPDDVTLVFGHTVTRFYQNLRPYEVWTNKKPLHYTNIIDIDCGCAANNEDSRLCCLRLDDREVFYE